VYSFQNLKTDFSPQQFLIYIYILQFHIQGWWKHVNPTKSQHQFFSPHERHKVQVVITMTGNSYFWDWRKQSWSYSEHSKCWTWIFGLLQ
jgi:hypothetical protein